MHQSLQFLLRLSYLMGNSCCQTISPGNDNQRQDCQQLGLPEQLLSSNKTKLEPISTINHEPSPSVPYYEKYEGESSLKQEQDCNRDVEDILKIFQTVLYFYQQHDIDSAMIYVRQITTKCKRYCIQSNKTEPELLIQLDKVYHIKQSENISITYHPFNRRLLQQVNKQYEDIIHYEQQITTGNWQQKSNSKGAKVYTRRQGNSVGVLIEMDLELPFQILISILIEMDLYKEFIMYNQISTQEKIFARNCRIGYNLNNYPILSKREAFFQGIGYSRLKHNGQIFMFTRSIHDRPDLQQYLNYKVNANPNYVQLSYKYFVVRYQPVRSGYGRLIMALNADMGLNFLPNFILQYMVKDFAKEFLTCVIEIGGKFKGSKWEQNVQKNPDLFNFFKKEIDNYLKYKNN